MKNFFVFLLFVFITHSVFATMMCDDASAYTAIYEINSYTCNSGEFLPANTLGCQSCPANATCTGGTFDFNANEYQGLVLNGFPNTTMNDVCADNFPGGFVAIYEPNQHTCNPGYYMPANTDGCVICPADSYCVGGTYSYSESNDSGIVACSNGYALSGAGASAQTDCYKQCTTNESPHATSFVGGDYYGGVNTCAPADANSCETGYNYVATNGNVLAHCEPNSITVNWGDWESESCSYGEELTVPATPPSRRGYTFVGWVFE